MTEDLSQLSPSGGGIVMSLVSWLRALPLDDSALVIPMLGAVIILATIWAGGRRRRPPRSEPTEIQDPELRVQALIARNQYEAAAEMRLAQGKFDKALSLFQNSGNRNKVALCHLSLKQPLKAAEVYLEMGRLAEAAHYFQTARAWGPAAKCLDAMGSRREAAELYERAGEYGKAAHHLRRLGDAENAARLFEMAGQGSEAAEALLSARGREPRALLRAGELFESGGDPRRAAECYAGAGEWFRAAELFEEVQEFALAAQAYEHAEAWAQAGASYERAGAYREARANFERAGDTLHAALLAQQLGNLLDAGRGFYELGSYERAIETLQGVPAHSPQLREATLLLGKIFLEKGLYERAKDKLRLVAPDRPASKDDIDAVLLLAEAHEGAGEYPAALQLLEAIIEIDPDDHEVSERLEKLQERAWGSSAATAAGYYNERYELRNEIGRGGMGIVHLAHDRELRRPVAIKFLPADLAANATAVKMFRQEARAAAAMNHPNIVHVYDVAVIDGRPCIVMEYVRGKTVRDLMRVPGSRSKRPLPIRQVAQIARDVCYALEYAHYQNVIHRDIKPGNVLISEQGETKLMDFGISKVLESGPRTESDTQAKGTPQYMPPEQILGRQVDARTDLYALGISLFEMLTTLRPFRGEDVVEKQLKAPLPDPREFVPNISEELVSIIRHACQKRPSDRYATAGEMAEALNTFLIRQAPGAKSDS
ncbi:MAG: protein kinase [Myxococcota bacterium]